MKIKTKRAVMLVLLFCGVVWNCLCMQTAIPLKYFTFSAIVIAGYSLMLACWSLLFPHTKPDEKSNPYAKLTSKEKSLSGMTLSLSAAWLITCIACIVYPL